MVRPMTCTHTKYKGCKPCPCTVTITIGRVDADYMAEDEWTDDRLLRIADACRAALEGER